MLNRKQKLSGLLLAGVMTMMSVAGVASVAGAAEFKSIFDGKSLEGWKSKQGQFWRVEGGAITAESTEKNPCSKNTFLVWQGGDVADFELKLKYRITGTDKANSGIQVRSQIFDDGHMTGYQCDLDLAGNWVGKLYDEHMPRKVLANRGEKVVYSKKGEKTVETFSDKPDEVLATIKAGDWNEYHIKARGHSIQILINGVKTIHVVDRQEGEFDASGLLAVQLHSGPPMKVQFKDIMLKTLEPRAGAKKKK